MKYIKRFIKEFKFVIVLFVTWRLLLTFAQVFIAPNLELQKNYLGGGMAHYESLSMLWGWANYDGEHYLSIAQSGYSPLRYFFFPLYPILIRTITNIVGISLFNSLIVGIIISNISFFLALVGLWKLIRLDYSNEIAKTATLLLCLFPTSFYFTAVYTESLFLLLSVWCFYYARTEKWHLSGFYGALSTATRLVGFMLLPSLLVEYYLQNKGNLINRKVIFLFIVPAGLVVYMFFLLQKTADPLAFSHSVEIFGEQRSSYIILLPQVFYRYIFKIIPVVPWSYLPAVYTTYLEFFIGVMFLFLSILSFYKMRLSYAIFLTGSYLLPTFSGSFSSLPRYVVTIFPAFILLAVYLNELPKNIQKLFLMISILLLFAAESLFMRGYWLA